MSIDKEALQAKVEHLEAELDNLQRQLDNEKARGIHSCGPTCRLDSCVNRRLREEIENIRKDAERYAFIRSGALYIEPGDGEIYVASDRGVYTKTHDEFDAEVDRAMT